MMETKARQKIHYKTHQIFHVLPLLRVFNPAAERPQRSVLQQPIGGTGKHLLLMRTLPYCLHPQPERLSPRQAVVATQQLAHVAQAPPVPLLEVCSILLLLQVPLKP